LLALLVDGVLALVERLVSPADRLRLLWGAGNRGPDVIISSPQNQPATKS